MRAKESGDERIKMERQGGGAGRRSLPTMLREVVPGEDGRDRGLVAEVDTKSL